MYLDVLPANPYLQQINEIDPGKIMQGHGIGFSAILRREDHSQYPAQLILFGEVPNLPSSGKETVVQVEGWVTECLPGSQFRVNLSHLKLDKQELIVDSSQIETHSSFRRSLRRHVAGL